MTAFIFAGDMLVMLFMIGIVLWVTCFNSSDSYSSIARIPLEDEQDRG